MQEDIRSHVKANKFWTWFPAVHAIWSRWPVQGTNRNFSFKRVIQQTSHKTIRKRQVEVIAISLISVIFLALSYWQKKIKQSICHLPSLSVNNTVLHLKVIKRYSKTLNTPDLILSILLTELLFLQHKLHQSFYRPTRTFFLDQPYPKLK